MSHKCIKCLQVFDDVSHEILQGCSCGSKAFLYKRDPSMTVLSTNIPVSTENSFGQIDIGNLIAPAELGEDTFEDTDEVFTVDVQALLDKKTIHSTEEGRYSINLQAIFDGQRPKL